MEESEKRREEKKKEDQRRERIRRKKMQVRKKVGKSQNSVFFQWFVAPEGRKVGSLKRRVRSHLARWEMKARSIFNFQVQTYKTLHVRTTFGSWDVQKVHAVVARSTFPSLNVQNTPVRSTFRSCDVEKVHAVVARSTFRSQKCKKLRSTEHFWTLRCRFAWQAQGIVHLVKSEQNVRVLWHFQKRWQAWDMWRGSAKMHFLWQAVCKRHVHQRC